MDFSTLLEFFPASLRELILADDISDVMVNEDGLVFIDRGGYLQEVTRIKESLVMAIQNVARRLGADIDAKNPFLDTRLPDGSRVAAVYSNGAMTVTIRKFNRWYSTEELMEQGCLPETVCRELVWGLLGAGGSEKANVLVSGGTGAGKSTLAKALIDCLPADERLIVIEKPRELAISHRNAVRWEASDGIPDNSIAGGWREAPKSVAQFLVHALRNRPSRIIIGEVREPLAAYELLQALNTGHAGSIATIHADSAEDALMRLTDLALAAHSNLSHEFVEKRVLRSIDYIVHMVRHGGARKVSEVLKVSSKREITRLYPQEQFSPTFENQKELSLCPN
jgi:pilus assembly protein CpaF